MTEVTVDGLFFCRRPSHCTVLAVAPRPTSARNFASATVHGRLTARTVSSQCMFRLHESDADHPTTFQVGPPDGVRVRPRPTRVRLRRFAQETKLSEEARRSNHAAPGHR